MEFFQKQTIQKLRKVQKKKKLLYSSHMILKKNNFKSLDEKSKKNCSHIKKIKLI